MTDATAPRAGVFRAAWANPLLMLVLTTLIWAGRWTAGGRPNRIDDADLHALGGRARADPHRRAAVAGPRLATSARALALSDRHGRGRLHRLRRAVLCCRASHHRAQPVMALALLGEPFAAYHVVALALVIGGIAIAQREAGRAG